MRPNVLLTGATGFIGGATVRAMGRDTNGRLRLLTHERPRSSTGADAGPAVNEVVSGDVADPSTLRRALRGIDTVIHAASYVGSDPQRAWEVNHDGTQALVAQARNSGVRRIVYVSTAAVYGPGPHHGPDEDGTVAAPVSAVSHARLAAESHVREAGGIVLRPHLIYGRGDRWFVPGLLTLSRHLGALVHGGRARVSAVSVDDLATALVRLADSTSRLEPGLTLHVNHPRPVTIAAVLELLAARLGTPVPSTSMSTDQARAVAERLGLGITDHQLSMVAQDNFFTSERIWRLTDHTPRTLQQALRECDSWYREHLPHS